MRIGFFLIFVLLSCSKQKPKEVIEEPSEHLIKAYDLYLKYETLSTDSDSLAQMSLHEATEILKDESNATDSLFKYLEPRITYLADNFGYDSANYYFEKYQLADKKELGSPKSQALYHYLKGYTLYHNQDFNGSIDNHNTAIEILDKNGDESDILLPSILGEAGFAYWQIDIEHKSKAYNTRAHELLWKYHQKDEPDAMVSSFMNLLQNMQEYGDWENGSRILNNFEEYFARLRSDEFDITEEQLHIFGYKFYYSKAYFLVLRPDKEVYQNLLAEFTEWHQKHKVDSYFDHYLYAFDSMGYGMLNEKHFDEAKAYFDKMLELAETDHNRMKALSNYASLYFAQDMPDLMLTYTRKSLAEKDFDSNDISYLILKLTEAKLMAEPENASEVQSMVKDAIEGFLGKKIKLKNLSLDDINNSISSRWMYILNSASAVYRKSAGENKEQQETALALSQLSLKMFLIYYEKGTFNFPLDETHKTINEEVLFNIKASNYNQEQILEVLEKVENGSSQHLWNSFLNKNIENLNLPENLLEEKNRLQIKLANLKDKAPEEASLKDSIAITEQRISQKNKGFSRNSYREFSVKSILGNLKNKQSILRYFVTENEVFATYLSKENVEIYHLANKDSLVQDINTYIDQLRSLDASWEETSAYLFKKLIGPIKEDLKDEIIIIPESFLQELPFETLVSKGVPIGLEHQISYAHGIQFLQHKSHKKATGLLSVAPDYSNSKYLNIPKNVVEIENIKQITATSQLLNSNASKKNFLASLGKYKAYHLAMHAHLDSTDFESSSLVFSNDEELKFKELYNLNFPASMVTLSACNTGVGQELVGEGLMSLSRAMTYAGVESVVHSLWRIPDTETAELMKHFYQNIKNGEAKNIALSNAKKQFIKENPLKQHPFYWAGFVTVGDNSPVDLEINNYWWLLLLLLPIGYFALRSFRRS
ncbi:CHAT domain-containing protein [uncultured Arcticibacterium sp.]|uniref:CHAT domain-containing protein n=1 Tax=uncultured Arcticibacterium sp. TaxID=2173042 RepID=UPI0030F6F4A3